MRRKSRLKCIALMAVCTTVLSFNSYAVPEGAVEESDATISESVQLPEAEESLPDVPEAAPGLSEASVAEQAESGNSIESAVEESVSQPERIEETTAVVAESAQETRPATQNDMTRWLPTSPSDKTKTIDLSLTPGLNKIEIFYGPNTIQAPKISLTSDFGTTYTAGVDMVDNDSFTFMMKKGRSVPSFPSISFNTVYLTSDENEHWRMTVTRDPGMDFLMIIGAKVLDDYKNFTEDYRTQPTSQILWMDKSQNLDYVQYIPKIIEADSDIETNIKPISVPEEKPDRIKEILFFIGLALVVIGGAAFFYISRSDKIRERRNEEKKAEMIKRANKRMREKLKKENDNLDEALKVYEDEYVDGPKEDRIDTPLPGEKENIKDNDLPGTEQEEHNTEQIGFDAEALDAMDEEISEDDADISGEGSETDAAEENKQMPSREALTPDGSNAAQPVFKVEDVKAAPLVQEQKAQSQRPRINVIKKPSVPVQTEYAEEKRPEQLSAESSKKPVRINIKKPAGNVQEAVPDWLR